MLEKSQQSSTITVPGAGGASPMHGLKYESRCRLCRLSKGTPEQQALLAEVHELRARGIGARSVASHIAGKLVGLGLAPIHGRSVRRHDKHIIRKAPLKAARAAVVRPNTVELCESNVPGEFGELVELLQRLIARIRELDSAPDAFSDASGKFDPYRLGPWVGLINSARSAIESLHKLRQSDQLLNQILEQNLATFAKAFAVPLGEELRSLLPLANGEVEVALRRMVYGDGVAGLAQEAARHALNDTRLRFKIGSDT